VRGKLSAERLAFFSRYFLEKGAFPTAQEFFGKGTANSLNAQGAGYLPAEAARVLTVVHTLVGRGRGRRANPKFRDLVSVRLPTAIHEFPAVFPLCHAVSDSWAKIS
jgi:hypothetical protein